VDERGLEGIDETVQRTCIRVDEIAGAFHGSRDVPEGRFNEIEPGSEVRYELEAGEKGLQASTVALPSDH
jgi:cold shock CspA family protein